MENDSETSKRRSRLGTIAVVAVVLLIGTIWGIAFFGRFDVPGRMGDRTFTASAEPLCKTARDRIAALPRAFETPTPSGRADVVDRATDELDAMLAALRNATPTADPERRMVGEWLTDWQTYASNRRDYADRLRLDQNARLYVSQSDRDKVQITRAIDRFAQVNDMNDCKTPDDVS